MPISLPLWGGTVTLHCLLGHRIGGQRGETANEAGGFLLSDGGVPMQLFTPGWPYNDTEHDFFLDIAFEPDTVIPGFSQFGESRLRASRNNVTFALEAMAYVDHNSCKISYRLEETTNS